MLGFWPYHAKWCDVLSNALWCFYLWNPSYVSYTQYHLFTCWLISRRTYLNMLWIIMLCISFFPSSRDAPPLVVYMNILNSSTSKLVTSIEFSKARYSSTLTIFHGCCSSLNFVRTKRMMRTGAHLYEVSMEANPRMEVTLHKEKSTWIISPGWRLLLSTVVTLGKVVIVSV